MNLADTYDEIVHIARNAQDPIAGWATLITYLANFGGTPLPDFTDFHVQQDVDDIRHQITQLLESEPPTDGLNAFYFGLFDALDDSGQETIGYYIAGVKGFNSEDSDSLCDPAWWPQGRYLTSAALCAIKQAELSFGVNGRSDLQALLGYAGQLGVALLVSRFASDGLLPISRRVVGFDSGDFAELDE